MAVTEWLQVRLRLRLTVKRFIERYCGETYADSRLQRWLFWLASHSSLYLFTAVFVVLNLSDWIDGRLTRWLKQRSDFGARLDRFADSVL